MDVRLTREWSGEAAVEEDRVILAVGTRPKLEMVDVGAQRVGSLPRAFVCGGAGRTGERANGR
ncbi:MAG: hypothetical protein U0232_25795 [Thermomicrobiales bacterium]